MKPTRSPRLDLALGILLGLAVALVVNYLSYRHYARFDWTAKGSFTLSDRTRAVVRTLDRDVTYHLLIPRDDELYGPVDELLRGLASLSRRIRVRKVDPYADEGRFGAVASRLGLVGENGQLLPVDVVVEAGSRRWNIRREDLVQVGASDRGGPTFDVGVEAALTGGLLEVVSGRKTVVCASTGHGELGLAPGERSLEALVEALSTDNVEVREQVLRADTAVPATCDALFVVGPQRPFAPDEASRVERYLGDGGRVLLAADPVLASDGTVSATGLEGVVGARGIELGRDVVVELDPGHLLGDDPLDVVKVDGWSDHPMVAPLRRVSASIAMHSARSVRATGASALVAETSAQAFAARNVNVLAASTSFAPGPGDARGPLGMLAVAPAGEAAQGDAAWRGRLVVIGDTDLFRAEALEQPVLGNGPLLSAMVGFLVERPALVSIPPRRARAVALMMPSDGPAAIRTRVVLLLPLAFALLGYAVHSSRRE